MNNDQQNNRKYDLEERTAKFAEQIILFVKILQKDVISEVLIRQITRSGTSIGANYMEADCAESKKDFRHKIAICKKESKETKYWLKIIATKCPAHKEQIEKLMKEAQELLLIFSKIIHSCDNKKNNSNKNDQSNADL